MRLFRPGSAVFVLLPLLGLVAVGGWDALPLAKAVGGSDCGRFAPAAIEVSSDPDPYYDPENGETVDTIDLVDTRTVEGLTAEVVAARRAQVQAADESLTRARQEADGSETVTAMVSFDTQRSIGEAWARASTTGLSPTVTAHGYASLTRVFVGEIPTLDANGVARTAAGVADEYVRTAQFLLDNATVHVSRDPSHAAQAVLADAQRRANDAVTEGIRVIGVAVTGALDQVTALADSADDLIVGVVPEGCDPQSAVLPESFVPILAAQAMDLPEPDGGPFPQGSPVAEGR